MKLIRIKDDPNRIDSVKFLEELREKDSLVKDRFCEEIPISASKAVILARGIKINGILIHEGNNEKAN